MMNSTKTSNKSHHFLCFLVSLIFLLFVPSFSLNIDGTLLLSFKYSIVSDPLSVLENWDYNDETPCLWSGVTCSRVGTSIGTPDMFRVINLVLPNSNLFGSIPEDLGLIQHLRTLDLSNNVLKGTLPISLFNATELQVLSLSNNTISGGMPEFSKGNKSLRLLNLSANALSGKIPKSLTSLENLTVVSLKSNHFSGELPSGFHEVEILDISSNLLYSSLPMDFGGENLRYLNLSANKFSGLISDKFAEKIPENCTIDLSFNNLTGQIPDTLPLSNQKAEYFSGNIQLCGKPLKKLCTIPSSLSKQPKSSINSSSAAIAVIPKNYDRNPTPDASGTTTNDDQNQPQHGLKPGAIAGIIVGDLAGIGVLALLILYVYQLRKKNQKPNTTTTTDKESYKSNNMVSEPPISSVVVKDPPTNAVSSSWSCLTIKNGEETSEATGSDTDDNKTNNDARNQVEYPESKTERSLTMFDEETQLDFETLFKASAYILGSSGASIVYKAVLHDGTSFAVRRIGENGALLRLKEFDNQVRAIAKLKHPNLVKVRGFYYGDDEKLMICDYISNGSLETAGYRKVGSSPYHLPFDVRLKIARGVARGLSYIHDKKHVHGNIKPSNILLNQEMEPVISDFGLQWLIYGKQNLKSDGSSARHFGSKRSTSSNYDHSVHDSPYIAPSGFIGCTSPYHAPESLQNLKPNPKWDVYSFGILLLELLTGKVYSDRELSQWSTTTITGSVEEDKHQVLRMVDGAIRGEVQFSKEEHTLACFKLGFSCASLNPQKRPSMKYAFQVLEKIPYSN
ncbi:hypothetical protein Leryth_004315 [Lithospermum erythrorhizon]|nr:hypothetical protein Leryth_004315 [Lithospermum erythrorhizon]